MKTKPTSLAVVLLSALGLALIAVLVAVAPFTPTQARQSESSGPVGNGQAAIPIPITPNKEFTLETIAEAGQYGFKGTGGEIDGMVNPDLIVHPGDIVRLTLVNSDGHPHDFFLPDLDTKTKYVTSIGDRTEVIFEVVGIQPGTYLYYCTVPGHRRAGQEGKLIVSEP